MADSHTPPRGSGAWWEAYASRMATDREFQKKVFAVVAERHMEASYLVDSRIKRRKYATTTLHKQRMRLYENEQARVRHPSPDPFEDGWRHSAESDAVSSLTANMGL